MSYTIQFTPEFNLDLMELDFALSEYPRKAERIIGKLDNAISHLSDNPEMYAIYEDFPIFRKIVIEDYLAFYVVNEDKRIVEIHRLVYGSRDMKRILS